MVRLSVVHKNNARGCTDKVTIRHANLSKEWISLGEDLAWKLPKVLPESQLMIHLLNRMIYLIRIPLKLALEIASAH